jgi:GMP synthase-like glutamine amidotransferase
VSSCLIVQHVEPEGPYAIGVALGARGVTVDLRRVFAGDALPTDVADTDGLVIMGGPMSATSDDGFPTRRAEIDLIGDALRRGLPTLGVCLGAQLLALAAGGAVFAGDHGPEIGWGPVELSEEAGADPLLSGLPQTLTVMHWHGDTYATPAGASALASSSTYEAQAFRIGLAWGFQFHLEVDERAVAAFVQAFGADARRAGVAPETIEEQSTSALGSLGAHRATVVNRFAAMVAARAREPMAELA